MKNIWKNLLIVALILLGGNSFAQEITGLWTSIDDKTGEEKSQVEIEIKDGKLYGTVVKLFNEDQNYNPLCDDCKGELHNKPVLGMQIINGLQQEDKRWIGDKGILDPENGKFYDVKIWVEGDELKIRGYIGFLYRTQTWKRAS